MELYQQLYLCVLLLLPVPGTLQFCAYDMTVFLVKWVIGDRFVIFYYFRLRSYTPSTVALTLRVRAQPSSWCRLGNHREERGQGRSYCPRPPPLCSSCVPDGQSKTSVLVRGEVSKPPKNESKIVVLRALMLWLYLQSKNVLL